MLNSSMLRERARIVLGNHIFKNEWMYAFLILLVASIASAVSSVIFVGPLLIGGLINFVLAKYFIERVRNNAFPARFPAINWDIKFTILDNVILGVIQSLLIALGVVLFIVPGIILACSYSMVYFIKCDNPEISAFDALSLSKRMMDGHKMEYFRLQLSFIGWYILGFLCFGIGVFWASAYNQAANAAFYEEIREVKY